MIKNVFDNKSADSRYSFSKAKKAASLVMKLVMERINVRKPFIFLIPFSKEIERDSDVSEQNVSENAALSLKECLGKLRLLLSTSFRRAELFIQKSTSKIDICRLQLKRNITWKLCKTKKCRITSKNSYAPLYLM